MKIDAVRMSLVDFEENLDVIWIDRGGPAFSI